MSLFSQHAVTAIGISNDGSRLATVGDQDCSKLIVTSLPPLTKDQENLKQSSNVVSTKTSSLTAIAWDVTNRIYTADSRGAINSYIYENDTLSRSSNIVAAHSGNALTDIAVSPNIVATTGKDGLVKVWDIQRSSCIARMKGHKGEARAISVGHVNDFHLLASAGRDRTVRLWDIRIGSAGMPIGILYGHEGWVHDVALCAGALPRVISCAGDKTVRIWDLSSRKIINVKQGHEFRVWSVAADPNGTFAVSGSTDTSVRYWDLSSNSNNNDGDLIWQGHDDSVLAVAVARDATFAISASENGSVVMWDVGRMTNSSSNHLDDTLHEINLQQVSTPQPTSSPLVNLSSPPPPPQLQQQHQQQKKDNFITPPHARTDALTNSSILNSSTDASLVKQQPQLHIPPQPQPLTSRETRPPLNPLASSASSPSRHIRAHFHHATLSTSVSLPLHQSPTLSTSNTSLLPSLLHDSNSASVTPTQLPRPIPSTPPRSQSSTVIASNIPSTPPPIQPRPNGHGRSPSTDHEARSSASADSSPRRRRRDDDEAAVAAAAAAVRIRKLEQMVATRDKQIQARDARLQGLENVIMQRERDFQLLKKQVESAENLAKQANVRALAAESAASISASASASMTEDSTDEPVDYTESIDRISRVTGKLKALAAKLDGLDIV